jgi:hypothetical protein
MSNPSSDRQQRLAQALRDNLRRRKGQARAKTDAPAATDGAEAPGQEPEADGSTDR